MFERHFTVAHQRMVRTKTHQLTFNASDTAELYDLVEDPYQLNNLYNSSEYLDVQCDLLSRMEKYMVELEDPLLGWFRRIAALPPRS